MSAQAVDILIIGSGFSGLTMAMEARRKGFTDIAILEKAEDIGGTWRENTYPGVACDVPSHLYSFARHLNPDWSTSYAGGNEIWMYMRNVARDEGLYELCHFGQAMTSARWDGARWQVETAEGQQWSARGLVSGIGALHIPLIPDVPGFFSFPGPSFHSAQWEHDLDLTGKHAAVIGTGASAAHFVPAIEKTAARVTPY
ncbi:MAG: flavin-containing monooxygenase [Paracoccaceae bacterium]